MADKISRWLAVGGLISLALLVPAFSYMVWPYYQSSYRRERIVRVDHDHDYFGAI